MLRVEWLQAEMQVLLLMPRSAVPTGSRWKSDGGRTELMLSLGLQAGAGAVVVVTRLDRLGLMTCLRRHSLSRRELEVTASLRCFAVLAQIACS